MVFTPLIGLVADEFVSQTLAKRGFDKGVVRESLDRLRQVLGQEIDSPAKPLFFGNAIKIVLVGMPRVDAFADSLKPRRENEGGRQIRIDLTIGVARLAATAPRWNAYRVGPVVRAI